MLVMEEVPGVLMSQFIRVRRQDPERAHRWAVLNGIDARTIARRLSITVLRQILEDNEFHGDMHPGNIMLLSDNQIALIDSRQRRAAEPKHLDFVSLQSSRAGDAGLRPGR